MARPPTGQVLERTTGRGRTYALRFRAYGKRHYLTLGAGEEGWSRRHAEEELANVLADVRRGIWKPPTPAPSRQRRSQRSTTTRRSGSHSESRRA